ncbi:MAG TPA: hypothetical protein PK358_13750 [Spirochaetota bacterium]|nr:hypothetical protein [Spirochaetota bacterium]
MAIKLKSGDRVCIAGGGPAGSFSAIHILSMAKSEKIDIEVIIVDARAGHPEPGPKSCKGCAGILSAELVSGMAKLGIEIPEEVILERLNSYKVHTHTEVVHIDQPENDREILSVYRGFGPAKTYGKKTSSFDFFLREEASGMGARIVSEKITLIDWDEKPLILTEHNSFSCDLLVLATGVNNKVNISEHYGYIPPRTISMIQQEIPRPGNWAENTVAAYFDNPRGFLFGAFVPKGEYMSISLLGKKKLEASEIKRFYNEPKCGLEKYFYEEPENLCHCTPRINYKPSEKYYGDRWVAVGDAAVTRLYKDGIGSSFKTSYRAMKTALHDGIGEDDFRQFYGAYCDEIAKDNNFGKILIRFFLALLKNRRMAKICMGCLILECHMEKKDRIYSKVLWGMITGEYAYRHLFMMMISIKGMLRFLKNVLRIAGKSSGIPVAYYWDKYYVQKFRPRKH